MQRTSRLELELGGKVRPMLFDHAFLDFLTEKQTLQDIDEIQSTKPWRYIPTLALAALRSGASFEGAKDKFTYEEVAKWTQAVEDALELNKIANAYAVAMGFTWLANTGRDLIKEIEDAAKASQNPSEDSNQSTGTSD